MASDDGREVGVKRRRDRLAASLRENLKRRKAQQRSRANETQAAEGASDSQPTPSHPLREV
jgi:hypothetical protein